MYRFLLVLFIALCAAQPTWVKRMGMAKRFGISNPLGDGSSTSTTTTSSTTMSTTTTTGSGSTTSPIIVTTGSGSTSTMYEIFALGGGSCKQGFIGQVNTAACWSSTCGIWTALKIRQLNNATITMFSTSACTGDAEKIYPVNPVGNVEQDCAFTTREFQSFRVIPGGVTVTNADQASLNPICQGGLTEIDCNNAASTCLGTVLT